MGLVTSGLVVPNFTEIGFKVMQGPADLHEKLRARLREGMDRGPRKEYGVDQIFSDEAPDFVDTGLETEVLQRLQPLHEEWAGVPLKPGQAYGLRLYPNNSFLTMHTDRLDTHVISSIFHVDRDQEEPWPLVIEDLHGEVHRVALEPGEILFYESAKLLHGRPIPFNGKWYTSMFVHFFPADWAVSQDAVIRSIPSDWNDGIEDNGEPRLTMVGTGLLEHCAQHWCDLEGENAVEVVDEQLEQALERQLGYAEKSRRVVRDEI